MHHAPPMIGDNSEVWWLRRWLQDICIPCKCSDARLCTRTHHAIHSRIDAFVSMLVGLNMLVVAMGHYRMSPERHAALELINHVFLAVFTIEITVKIVAVGPVRFWTYSTNIFDGCVVLGSALVLLLTADKALVESLHLTLVTNLLRVLRMVRLLEHFPRLHKLAEHIVSALPSIWNVSALLFVVLYVGTLIAMHLFAEVRIVVSQHP